MLPLRQTPAPEEFPRLHMRWTKEQPKIARPWRFVRRSCIKFFVARGFPMKKFRNRLQSIASPPFLFVKGQNCMEKICYIFMKITTYRHNPENGKTSPLG